MAAIRLKWRASSTIASRPPAWACWALQVTSNCHGPRVVSLLFHYASSFLLCICPTYSLLPTPDCVLPSTRHHYHRRQHHPSPRLPNQHPCASASAALPARTARLLARYDAQAAALSVLHTSRSSPLEHLQTCSADRKVERAPLGLAPEVPSTCLANRCPSEVPHHPPTLERIGRSGPGPGYRFSPRSPCLVVVAVLARLRHLVSSSPSSPSRTSLSSLPILDFHQAWLASALRPALFHHPPLANTRTPTQVATSPPPTRPTFLMLLT